MFIVRVLLGKSILLLSTSQTSERANGFRTAQARFSCRYYLICFEGDIRTRIVPFPFSFLSSSPPLKLYVHIALQTITPETSNFSFLQG